MPAGYYKKNKERLKKKACDRYQNLSEKYKIKKKKYGRQRYRNVSEE